MFASRGKILLSAALVCVLALGAMNHAAAQGYYEGKKLTLWIGGGVAGGVNRYGRMFARHVVKHLPGTPEAVVSKNLPGAGGVGAVKTLYGRAKKDGTEFGTFALGPVTDPLLRPKRKHGYDMLKFNWVGAMNDNVQICHVHSKGPLKTIEDVMDQIVTVGATGRRSQSAKIPMALNASIGTRFKIIAGYRGSGGSALAFEKGEVQAICTSLASIKASRKHFIDTGLIRIIIQTGARKHPDLPHIRLSSELAKSKKQKALLKFATAHLAMSQPIALPPGVPAQRVAEWRKAFAATMKDPAFLEEAKRTSVEIQPKNGDEVLAIVKGIYATPKDIVKATAKAFRTKVTACDYKTSKAGKKCRKPRKRKKKKS
ncbi:MAG: hypothetical protein HOM58_15955 [Rhodospirillaceae bacterium]|jgi:tripartite-type tricarboxylate transporter receptor subunit TctC|nr:hypothetical protein [Rhodospirillaceae bacterium]MBT5459544.1 hypothetical protein [Rhodospirillaceae bacterium]